MSTFINSQYTDVKNTHKYLPDIIGKGYAKFWNYKGRYRVVKGGRGSKKSTTASLFYPYMMMKYYEQYGLKPSTLVIRRFYTTHRDSTYAQLRWAINRLGVSHKWKSTLNPLSLTYKPSGQKILFRGLDDPESISSIVVEDGYLCWVLWEEAFQITNQDDFNKVDLSIRGEVPDPLFKQHTLILNPWSEKTWIKKRFFDKVDENGLSIEDDILAITRNFDVNEFLGEDDLKIFERMKKENPRRYSIEGLGNWGISEGVVFENWVEQDFDAERMKRARNHSGKFKYQQLHGMDFGYTNDPTAFIAILVDANKREIYVFDEVYKYRMSNKKIYDTLDYMGYRKAKIKCDNDPRTINELRELGLYRAVAADKGAGSVQAGINKLQDYKIIVHPKCTNTIVELNNYIWKPDKNTGKASLNPVDEYNHLMDALRYATEDIGIETFSW